MWYNINFGLLAVQMLLVALRKPALSAFVQVCLKPVDSIYLIWKPWREENIYRLEHNGQICYLRKALNDKFDPVQRRIYIGDGNIYDKLYIYTQAEEQHKYLGKKWLRTRDETGDTGVDFIVWVPAELYPAQMHGLNALIRFYKAGGKRYAIYTIYE